MTLHGQVRGGVIVFDPPVALPEGAEVQVEVMKSSGQDKAAVETAAWLQQVQKLQANVVSRRGPLPDSTPDIAADRVR
jgi:hypothetical protein